MKIEILDPLMSPKLPPVWKAASIILARGGEMGYAPYGRLSNGLRKQWDALESFLICLSKNRYLYVVGSFETVPQNVEKFLSEQRKHNWLGTCQLIQFSHLHDILVGNPIEWFDYVITETALSPEVACRLIEVPRKKHFFEHIIDCCSKSIYCIIEENNDRDFFDLMAKSNDLDKILQELKTVLEEFGFELKDSRLFKKR